MDALRAEMARKKADQSAARAAAGSRYVSKAELRAAKRARTEGKEAGDERSKRRVTSPPVAAAATEAGGDAAEPAPSASASASSGSSSAAAADDAVTKFGPIAISGEEALKGPSKPSMHLRGADYPDDASELVYKFYKRLLKEWAQDVVSRTEAEGAVRAGVVDKTAFVTAAEFLAPFLRKAKHSVLDKDVLGHVHAMVLLQLERRYREAGGRYMSLAVGDKPWPIGVGSFGIHERPSRTQIRSDNISREGPWHARGRARA